MTTEMAADDDRESAPTDTPPKDSPDLETLRQEVAELRTEIADRTVSRSSLQQELHRYIRARIRRGHVHGWGPYLVLLYGTLMTLGAFYFLNGGWAIAAMLVIWLSTLGLYILMVLIGTIASIVDLPSRLRDRINR